MTRNLLAVPVLSVVLGLCAGRGLIGDQPGLQAVALAGGLSGHGKRTRGHRHRTDASTACSSRSVVVSLDRGPAWVGALDHSFSWQLLGELAAPGDHVARVGGDEFAVLTDGSVADAQALVTLLHKSLRRERLDVSFGYAAFPSDAVGPLELFRKADDRLLGSKLLGRNRRAVLALTTAAEQSLS